MSRKKKLGRPKVQFCPKGHDTFIYGRDKSMGRCLECIRIYHLKLRKRNAKKLKKYNHENYIKNKKKRVRQVKKWRKKHNKSWKSYIIQYQKDHKEEKKERARKYFQKHKKQIIKYRKAHPEIYKLALLKQSKKRSERIPKFGQQGIRKFYANCPKNKQIDHIIPLLGKKVSGLHVRWNLQYLTPSQNGHKNNTCDLVKVSERYGRLLEKLGLKDKKKKSKTKKKK
jgi:hypothetical protein